MGTFQHPSDVLKSAKRTMRSLLKKILPWHLRRTLMWARYYHARRKPPFAGVWNEFPEAAPTSPWSANIWTGSSRHHADKARRRYLADTATAIPDNPQPSKALLPFLVSTLPGYGSRAIRILDFGGAGGVDFAHLAAALGNPPAPLLQVLVVDMPESCDAGREVWRDEARISFSSRLPNESEQFDIVYADGAVHMVEDTTALLAAFAAYRPTYLLFCKTSMHEGPAFVRKQVNMGPDLENPQWVLDFDGFRKRIESLGYDLTYRGYGEDSYNVDNYPAEYRAGRTVNLLFRRRDSNPA
jgi:putative methyltransferase (TIGR04325 family)